MPGADGRPRVEQAGGCGGFGKGNFTALFKSIEVGVRDQTSRCLICRPETVISEWQGAAGRSWQSGEAQLGGRGKVCYIDVSSLLILSMPT